MSQKRTGLLLGCIGAPLLLIGAFSLFLLAGLYSARGGSAMFASRRVGLVNLIGTIEDTRAWVDELEAMAADASVKAVVIRVDSPGGSVAPSQELHDAVIRLKAEKPVVASLGSVAASGGYYAIVAADSIVANPGTLTGSIGVIFSFPTAVGLMDKLGVRYWTYTSGQLKDMGSFSREPTPEEEDLLDALVGDVFEQFLDAVMDGRGMTREELLPLADGRVFTGRQAVDAGLIDGLGDLHEAILIAGRLGGIAGEPPVVTKARPRLPWIDLLERLYDSGARFDGGPRLEYRLR